MALKVFYLDDEIDLCEIFFETFDSPEIEVKVFSEPSQILEAVQSNPPDVIFLDYRLPNTTGDLVALKMNNAIPKYLMTGELDVVTVAKFEAILTKANYVNDIQRVLNQKLQNK
jgi:DNA-binding NtrC family response regulator